MMKSFNSKISLARNGRGCYILDTVKGCSVCGDSKTMGCYDNCYAKAIADRYNLDFTIPVDRDFERESIQLCMFDSEDQSCIGDIVKQIKSIDMPFVRIGEMGDPSEKWGHTIDVCEKISIAGKPIVIITKHWKTLPEWMMERLSELDVCINTSISALDSSDEIDHRLRQYERLKPYCKSVLRVVTCDFNTYCQEGIDREVMQQYLLRMENVLETVFRPRKENRLVVDGIINIKKVKFLGQSMLASMRNENAFIGYCNKCPDMCGIQTKEYL